MGLFDDLSFGWRTAVLAVPFVQLLLISGALLRVLENRLANRTLAALLIVLAGIVTPWMIGFAGFYDRWQWLSFVPVSITLAVAPLFWLYVHALLRGRWPECGWRHLVPALAQFAYLAICFVALPLPIKDEWLGQQAYVYGLITGLGVIAGLTCYGLRARNMIFEYRRQLPEQVSNEHRYAVGWLSQAMAALFVLLGVWTLFGVWDLISPLNYRGFMGLYIAIAAIALFLGVQGLRHADRRFPVAETESGDVPARDWQALGERWAAETRAGGWHRDPELSLALLARRLGTNTSYLSRALNDGLGLNFATFINRLRCEDVAAAIDAGREGDLLDLALEAGFSSKASFNRAFLSRYGMAPSDYRRERVSKAE